MNFMDIKDQLFLVAREIPDLEMEFYEDQNRERRMELGGVDREEKAKKMKESEKLKRKEDDIQKEFMRVGKENER